MGSRPRPILAPQPSYPRALSVDGRVHLSRAADPANRTTPGHQQQLSPKARTLTPLQENQHQQHQQEHQQLQSQKQHEQPHRQSQQAPQRGTHSTSPSPAAPSCLLATPPFAFANARAPPPHLSPAPTSAQTPFFLVQVVPHPRALPP